MQLNPHFLFNTLHSISELVHEDAEAADRMIARLSDLLRRSLDTNEQEVPLREELEFLGLYLEIERARFDERLTVSYAIPADLESAFVPNMILQPLVENAIRHGIAPRLTGGSVAISAHRAGSELLLTVSDNGAVSRIRASAKASDCPRSAAGLSASTEVLTGSS